MKEIFVIICKLVKEKCTIKQLVVNIKEFLCLMKELKEYLGMVAESNIDIKMDNLKEYIKKVVN